MLVGTKSDPRARIFLLWHALPKLRIFTNEDPDQGKSPEVSSQGSPQGLRLVNPGSTLDVQLSGSPFGSVKIGLTIES